MSDLERTKVTFRQAEGLEHLPTPLKLTELSMEARSLIWAVLYTSIYGNRALQRGLGEQYAQAGSTWRSILKSWYIRKLHIPIDEFDPLLSKCLNYVKEVTLTWPYDRLFDFLTFVLRSDPPISLFSDLSAAFVEARLAYRIDGSTIYPASSPEEGKTVAQAFLDLRSTEYNGARAHLNEAASLLSFGDYAGGVRESINAVESVARVIEPRANTLSDAMRKLSSSSRINSNFRRGVEALYAYAGDEPGVRHALVFEAQSNVDAADAVYMFGACAAFVSFLIAKSAATTI